MEIICFTLKEDAESVLNWIRNDFQEKISIVKIEKFIPFSNKFDFISKDDSNIASIQIDTRINSREKLEVIAKEYSSVLKSNDKIISFTVSCNNQIYTWDHGSLGLSIKDLAHEEKIELQELKEKLSKEHEDRLAAIAKEAKEMSDEFEKDIALEKAELQKTFDEKNSELESKALAIQKEKNNLERSVENKYYTEYKQRLEDKTKKYINTTKECVRREQELTAWTNSFKENLYCFLIGLSMLTVIIPLLVHFGTKIRKNHLRNAANSMALDSIQKNDRMSMLRVRCSPEFSNLDGDIKLLLSETITKDEMLELQNMEAEQWESQLKEKENARIEIL